MPRRSAWNDLLWGPYPFSIATVTFAVLGFLDDDKRPLWLIIVVAGFLIVHGAVAHIRDRSIVRRLGQNYDAVQRRSVQIVSDLGQLTGNQYDLWMADLYLPKYFVRCRRGWPWLVVERRLSRELSVSLVEVSSQPQNVALRSTMHGKCFSSAKTIVWFDENDLGTPTDETSRSVANEWSQLTHDENARIASHYGVVTVAPLVDHLSRNCLGVLVVHVRPERTKALHARGAILSSEGRRRIHNACVDLQGLLEK